MKRALAIAVLLTSSLALTEPPAPSIPKASDADIAACMKDAANRAQCRQEICAATTEALMKNPLFASADEDVAKRKLNLQCLHQYEVVAKDESKQRAQCEQMAEASQMMHLDLLAMDRAKARTCTPIKDCTKRAKCEVAEGMKQAEALRAAAPQTSPATGEH